MKAFHNNSIRSRTPERGFTDSIFKISRAGIVMYIAILMTVFIHQDLFSQGVGISENQIDDPHPSAILELRSEQRGFLAPRMTTGDMNAITSPAQGLMVFNIDTNSYWYYDGMHWKYVNFGLGLPNQVLGMNEEGNANEYKTLFGTENQISIQPETEKITFSLPQDIHNGATPTFQGLILNGLTPNAGIYTDNTRGLTTTPPSEGTIGYWTRTGASLSPSTTGDHITTSGNISTAESGGISAGSGGIFSLGLISGTSGLTASGAISLNYNSEFETQINTESSTGNVTIGGASNSVILHSVILPAFTSAGIVHNNADGVLYSGLLVNDDIPNGEISLSKLVSGSDAQIIAVSSEGIPAYVPMSGDVTIDNSGFTTISDNAITSDKLAENAVTESRIDDSAVSTNKLQNGSVDFAKIRNVSPGIVLGNFETVPGPVQELPTTGTGAVVRAGSAELETPDIGDATGTSLDVTGAISASSLVTSGSITSSGSEGIGYSKGSWEEQEGSKSDRVEINTISGQIKMYSSVLVSNEVVSFWVDNNNISETDVPIVAISSGSSKNCFISVNEVLDGSFRITLMNVSGEDLEGPLTINFAIIKASNN